ncbi:MAG: cytochrome c3 family protein [Nitrospirota bacterium]
MKGNRLRATGFVLVFCFILFILTTKAISAPNTYGITNTRHNLLFNWQPATPMASIGDIFRNNYGEVCVYCHTPHGAQNSNAPLWNRTLPATGNYTPYSSTTIDTSVGQPDGVSLACLSCHDGTIAIDSIINAPGSGTAWGGPVAPNHYALAEYPAQSTNSCLLCHRTAVLPNASFEAMALTQNLSNQHPISMNYPTPSQDPKFNPPTNSNGSLAWFETGGMATRADDNEIKLFSDGAGGYKVQCASCHNPHGTLSPDGVNLYPTFLRKANNSSDLCITCHIK